MRSRIFLSAVLLAVLACDRKAAPPPQPETREAPKASAPKKPTVPWTWRPLGNLVVLEGDIPEAADLVLSGPRIYETRRAQAGVLRWEIVRPPEGERAELRTTGGKILARFRFEKLKEKRPALDEFPESDPAPAPPTAPVPEPPKVEPPRIEPPKIEVPRPEPLPSVNVEPQLKSKFDLPPLRRGPAPILSVPGKAAAPPWTEILPPPPILPPAVLQGGTWPGAGEGLNLARGPRGGKRLVLSFDGGSTSEVAGEILDTLKVRKVRTTLFLTGAFIQRYPALVRRMAQDGHELGNHTMNHPHFAPSGKRDPKWTRERFQRELLDADQALFALLGRPMDPLWRAPYGEQTPEIRKWAEEVGYRHVGWSEGADTLDWATAADRRLYRSGTAILERLYHRLGKNGDGMIVLMHLGSARTEEDRPATNLGAFMDRASRDGWRFVTAGAYLRELGKPDWNPAARIAMLHPATGRAGGSQR